MDITRIKSSHRLSEAVIHGGTIYLAGQVGASGESATVQAEAILAQVDELLATAGSSKSRLLSAIVWLADMAYFPAVNAVWDKWIDGVGAPARATGEVRLADPGYKVEIIITAAVG